MIRTKLSDRVKKASAAALSQMEEDAKNWENEVRRLQAMLPKEATRDKLKNKEIPALDQQLADEESKLQEASKEAESVGTL